MSDPYDILDPQARAYLTAHYVTGGIPMILKTPQDARDGIGVDPSSPKPVGTVEDRFIPAPHRPIPVRIYTPVGEGAFPILIFIHGGGFVLCNLDTHDAICRNFCREVGCIVVSVDYALAPEYKFPVATDECLAATHWVIAHAESLNGDPARIAIAGDSAGGNLAAVTVLRLRDEGNSPLCAQLLIYPVLDHYSGGMKSYEMFGEGFGLSRAEMAWFFGHYLNESSEANHLHVSPLRSPNLEGLPPTLIIAAECDVLRDEGKQYAQRLAASGVLTQYSCYQGMIHAFFGDAAFNQARNAERESYDWLCRQFQKRRKTQTKILERR